MEYQLLKIVGIQFGHHSKILQSLLIFKMVKKKKTMMMQTFFNAFFYGCVRIWKDVKPTRTTKEQGRLEHWEKVHSAKISFCQALQRKGRCRHVLQNVAEGPNRW
jgi:hypothetical protein